MVIISNGHSKFILGTAAVEAHRRKFLDLYITAGYPTKNAKNIIRKLHIDRFASVSRLLSREEEIPHHLVQPLWLPEIISQVAGITRNLKFKQSISEFIENSALRIYGNEAARIVQNSTANIYHYRAGYGHKSVNVAKKKGMVALCDHSIAHPALMQYLIENQGKMPQKGQTFPIINFWKNILEDINQADYIVVNSDFVKETFLHQGYSADRIHVAYAGVDRAFLATVPIRSYSTNPTKPLKLLFAGEFGQRKGAEVLISALRMLPDLQWKLEIIGTINPEISTKFASFFQDKRVDIKGYLPRLQLAQRMSEADVFIFPSLAEGSARVVFMAMACGCYVITTPNSGSIVKDNVHGSVVNPGDTKALESAVRSINESRHLIEKTGKYNAEVISNEYTQEQYGSRLNQIYSKLINSR